MAVSCCCCCVVVGQLSQVATRRRRACAVVSVSLWLLTLVFLALELAVMYVGEEAGDGDIGEQLFSTIGTGVYASYVVDAIRGRIDLTDRADRLALGLKASSFASLCLLWSAAAVLLAVTRALLRRRFRSRHGPRYPSCCVPCAACQQLAALGYSASNYRLCEPLRPAPRTGLPPAAAVRV